MPSTTNKPASKSRAPRKPAQPKPEAVADVATQPAASEGAALFDPPAGEAETPTPPADETAVTSATSDGVDQTGPAVEQSDNPDAAQAVAEVTAAVATTPPEADPSDQDGDADDGEGDEEQATEPAPSVAVNAVRLGHVEGVLHRVPLTVLQDLLADGAERIAALQGSRSILDLQARVRATEGRCAPVFLTLDQATEDAIPQILAGYETVAAALNVGLNDLPVVIIAAADAVAAQTWLAGQQAKKDDTETEDDLIHQVLAYHD